MRNLLSGVLVILGTVLSAQIAIDKSTVDGDGLLDFAAGTTKGIILPSITSTPGVVEGTIVFDSNDNKIKYFNGSWVSLNADSGESRMATNTVTDIANSNQGVIIGAESTDAPGVLVLESDDKALILPKVASPELSVVNPEAGMICYDTTTQRLSVFNGKVWEVWS